LALEVSGAVCVLLFPFLMLAGLCVFTAPALFGGVAHLVAVAFPQRQQSHKAKQGRLECIMGDGSRLLILLSRAGEVSRAGFQAFPRSTLQLANQKVVNAHPQLAFPGL
jgi:hypothetical protein